jgi:membrane associated rhomboid family serine protease
MPIRLTRAVKFIMIACFAAFVVQNAFDRWFDGNLLSIFALVPSGFMLDYRVWQLFTYAFLHGDVTHLFLNLMMLVFIGSELEAFWGTARFLRYYFFCSFMAGVLYLFLQIVWWHNPNIPMVGASGAIYGLLMAYGLIFGERVLLFMLLFPMKAKHFVWILAGLEFMTTVFSERGGLAASAHLGGMFAGFGYLWVKAMYKVSQRRRKEQGTLKARKKRQQSGGHLKLIINNEKDLDREISGDDAEDGPKTWH